MLIMIVTLAVVAVAAVFDLTTRKIPNFITLPALVFGFILNLYYCGSAGLRTAFIGFAAGILFLIIPFALGGMGAGDVKLLAAVGALNGAGFTLYTFVYGAAVGGVMALVLVIFRRKIFPALLGISEVFRTAPSHIFNRKTPELGVPAVSGLTIPYGAAIFCGTLAAYWVR